MPIKMSSDDEEYELLQDCKLTEPLVNDIEGDSDMMNRLIFCRDCGHWCSNLDSTTEHTAQSQHRNFYSAEQTEVFLCRLCQEEVVSWKLLADHRDRTGHDMFHPRSFHSITPCPSSSVAGSLGGRQNSGHQGDTDNGVCLNGVDCSLEGMDDVAASTEDTTSDILLVGGDQEGEGEEKLVLDQSELPTEGVVCSICGDEFTGVYQASRHTLVTGHSHFTTTTAAPNQPLEDMAEEVLDVVPGPHKRGSTANWEYSEPPTETVVELVRSAPSVSASSLVNSRRPPAVILLDNRSQSIRMRQSGGGRGARRGRGIQTSVRMDDSVKSERNTGLTICVQCGKWLASSAGLAAAVQHTMDTGHRLLLPVKEKGEQTEFRCLVCGEGLRYGHQVALHILNTGHDQFASVCLPNTSSSSVAMRQHTPPVSSSSMSTRLPRQHSAMSSRSSLINMRRSTIVDLETSDQTADVLLAPSGSSSSLLSCTSSASQYHRNNSQNHDHHTLTTQSTTSTITTNHNNHSNSTINSIPAVHAHRTVQHNGGEPSSQNHHTNSENASAAAVVAATTDKSGHFRCNYCSVRLSRSSLLPEHHARTGHARFTRVMLCATGIAVETWNQSGRMIRGNVLSQSSALSRDISSLMDDNDSSQNISPAVAPPLPTPPVEPPENGTSPQLMSIPLLTETLIHRSGVETSSKNIHMLVSSEMQSEIDDMIGRLASVCRDGYTVDQSTIQCAICSRRQASLKQLVKHAASNHLSQSDALDKMAYFLKLELDPTGQLGVSYSCLLCTIQPPSTINDITHSSTFPSANSLPHHLASQHCLPCPVCRRPQLKWAHSSTPLVPSCLSCATNSNSIATMPVVNTSRKRKAPVRRTRWSKRSSDATPEEPEEDVEDISVTGEESCGVSRSDVVPSSTEDQSPDDEGEGEEEDAYRCNYCGCVEETLQAIRAHTQRCVKRRRRTR